MTEKMMHIDGLWTRAQSTATRDIINPFRPGRHRDRVGRGARRCP
jgi:hypothetical protein